MRLRSSLARLSNLVKIAFFVLACFTVNAETLRVIDGDTFSAKMEIWQGSDGPITVVERIRVLGVNTPENKKETKAAYEAAKKYTTDWLGTDQIRIFWCKRDSFGRILGTVTKNGNNLASDTIRDGHGVPYK